MELLMGFWLAPNGGRLFLQRGCRDFWNDWGNVILQWMGVGFCCCLLCCCLFYSFLWNKHLCSCPDNVVKALWHFLYVPMKCKYALCLSEVEHTIVHIRPHFPPPCSLGLCSMVAVVVVAVACVYALNSGFHRLEFFKNRHKSQLKSTFSI